MSTHALLAHRNGQIRVVEILEEHEEYTKIRVFKSKYTLNLQFKDPRKKLFYDVDAAVEWVITAHAQYRREINKRRNSL